MANLPRSRSGRSVREVACQVAREEGALLVDYFRRPREALGVKSKSRGNVVTEADLQGEKLILKRLADEFPGWQVMAEESKAKVNDSPYTWIVDPLDGTNNFSFGLPYFCVTMAALHDREAEFGLVYDPLREEMFWAERGGGAYLNGQPLSVSTKDDLVDSLVALDMGYDDARGTEMLEFLRCLWPGVFSFRILGSGALALAYVALGRLDAYMHRRLYPWDIAGGTLLVKEAGGAVTDWQGQPVSLQTQSIVAAGPGVHSLVMGRMTGFPSS
ncbi:MAG: inositol monophosphatase family protein [Dehalococcoidia bacterium]|nr:inositol monophosphatase family protein [Dehalococcoidia bacterium]